MMLSIALGLTAFLSLIEIGGNQLTDVAAGNERQIVLQRDGKGDLLRRGIEIKQRVFEHGAVALRRRADVKSVEA